MPSRGPTARRGNNHASSVFMPRGAHNNDNHNRTFRVGMPNPEQGAISPGSQGSQQGTSSAHRTSGEVRLPVATEKAVANRRRSNDASAPALTSEPGEGRQHNVNRPAAGPGHGRPEPRAAINAAPVPAPASKSIEPGEICQSNVTAKVNANRRISNNAPVPDGRRDLSVVSQGRRGGIEVPAFGGYTSEYDKSKSVNAAAHDGNKNSNREKASSPKSASQDTRPSTLESDMDHMSLFGEGEREGSSLFMSRATTAAPADTAREPSEEQVIYIDQPTPEAPRNKQPIRDIRDLPGFGREQEDVEMDNAESLQRATLANQPSRGKQSSSFYGPAGVADMEDPETARALELARKRNEKLSQMDPDFEGDDDAMEHEPYDFETPASAAPTPHGMELAEDEVDQAAGGNNTPGSDEEMDIDHNVPQDQIEPITPNPRKRLSPEPTVPESTKRVRSARKDQNPKFTVFHLDNLDVNGATHKERLEILGDIAKLWRTTQREALQDALPRDIWPLYSHDSRPTEPKDWSTKSLLKLKAIAQVSPGIDGREAAIQALNTVIRRRNGSYLLYLSDVDEAIAYLRQQRARPQQTLAETLAAEACASRQAQPQQQQRPRQSAARRDSGRSSSNGRTSPIKSEPEHTPTSPTSGYARYRALLEVNASDLQSLPGDDLRRLKQLLESETNRRIDEGAVNGSNREAAIPIL